MNIREMLSEIASWHCGYIDIVIPDAKLLDMGDEKELREQSIVAWTKLNYMVNYLEKRITQLKGDLAEAKVFDTSLKEAMLSARLNELEALMEAQPVDSLV